MYGLGSLWGVCTCTAGALFWGRHHFPPCGMAMALLEESKLKRESDPCAQYLSTSLLSFIHILFYGRVSAFTCKYVEVSVFDIFLFFFFISNPGQVHLGVHRRSHDNTGGGRELRPVTETIRSALLSLLSTDNPSPLSISRCCWPTRPAAGGHSSTLDSGCRKALCQSRVPGNNKEQQGVRRCLR